MFKFNKNFVNISNEVAFYTLHIVLDFAHFLCNPYFLNHDNGHRKCRIDVCLESMVY
jgi:hypothetical protein